MFNPFAATSPSHRGQGGSPRTRVSHSEAFLLDRQPEHSPYPFTSIPTPPWSHQVYSAPDLASSKSRPHLTFSLLDGNQGHRGVFLSPVSLPTSGSLSPWKVPAMLISEARGCRWEEEVDLALEPAGAGTGVTGLDQPSPQDQEAELPKEGPKPRATTHTSACGGGPVIYHPEPQHLPAWSRTWAGS